ncbi:MAG: phosphomannomutase/phosphoglucomutase [Patescibacteria group bacterium]|jgi:phosphomannomutase|nr:phosphomannomutase/phosphoglucomutase [Patescibacteria group bacterium]
MNINPGIFKAYDIRGVYDVDFDDDVAYKIGLAFGKMRQEETGKKTNIKVLVGADMRLSSPALKKRLIEGFLDAGCDVTDGGLLSTPTFYHSVAHNGFDGGILVSASHNPGEYNGFKIVRERAIPFSGDTGMTILRDMVLENKLEKAEKKGELKKYDNYLSEQIKHDLTFGKLDSIKPLKIVIDPANAMGILFFDELFKYIPGEFIKINWELDGTFPAHEADPLKSENLEQLSKKVLEENADLGITTDGDGDRIFFVDNKGVPVEPGITRAILSEIFLKEKPGSKIAYDIRPGKITEDTIIENGGTPIVTRVGHSLIKEQALKEGAYFAGESSGHFFLNMEDGCYEVPVIVTLKMLEKISEIDIPFSEYVEKYQKYFHSGEINSVVEDKEAKIEEIKKTYKDAKQNELDGITIEYPNFWFNVRQSNTEPLLRLNLEARTKEIMEEKRDEVLKIINL